MNKKNLVKIINKELTILADFVEGFNESENIHPMEVDLALSKVKDIYDELLLLKGVIPVKEAVREVADETPSGITHKIDAVVVEKSETKHPVNIPEPENREPAPPVLEEVSPVREEIPPRETESQEPIQNKEEEAVDAVIEDAQKEEKVPEASEPKKEEAKVEKLPEPFLKTEKEQGGDDTQTINTHETIPEPVKASVPAAESGETLAPKAKKEASSVAEPEKNEIVADKFSKNTPSVNDMMAGVKKNKDLASYLKAGPIADLKKAIKLNDRIWYINELFKKNGASFEKAVDEINAFDNLDEALEYIFTNFKWDQNRKSTISFLELVFRRFATK